MGKKSNKSQSQQKKDAKKNPFQLKQKTEKQQNQININKGTLKWCKSQSTLRRNQDKKIKLKPLRDLFIQPNKNIKDMNINELKEFAHKFDINADINYNVLFHLQKNEPEEFNKYIQKYRYSLNFNDALLLNCFDKNYILNTLNEYNNNMNTYQLESAKVDSINNIHSFSKLKIFNLLFFLLKKDINKLKIEDLEKKILFYSVPETLIFKIPNKYGNIELQYYTYLIILADLLLREINGNKDSKLGAEDYTSSLNKGIFFNFKTQEKIEEEEVNLEEFYERKKILEEYLKEFDIEDKNNIQKFHTNKKKEEKNIEYRNKDEVIEKINIIQLFEKNIKEIITLKDDIQIIQRISFIIKSLLFFDENEEKQLILTLFSKCLEINNNSEDEKYPNRLTKANLDLSFNEQDKNNPFKCKPKYFLYPDLLTKNIIQNDKELFDSFKNLLKHIYSSKIIKDIFYLIPEFSQFLYPFDDKEFLEELFEMTTFLPFPSDILMSYTFQEIPEILISVNVTASKSRTSFSKIICQLAQILNTCIHEQLRNYMKALIFYNSFQFGIKNRTNSNLFEVDEERKFINSVFFKINHEDYLNSLDEGEKEEILLYGNRLKEITFSQSLELFKLNNWDKTIPQHIKNFIEHKKIKKNNEYLEIEKIKIDKDYCEFFKVLAIKFNQYLQRKNETGVLFDYTMFAAKNTSNIFENENVDKIKVDNSYRLYFHREKRDSNY